MPSLGRAGSVSFGAVVRPHGRWNVLAISALVLSVLWVFFAGSALGVFLGFAALYQINRTGQRGRWLAVVAIVLGVVWFVLLTAELSTQAVVIEVVAILAVFWGWLELRRPLTVSCSRLVDAPRAAVSAALADPYRLAALGPLSITATDVDDLPSDKFTAHVYGHWHRLGFRFAAQITQPDPTTIRVTTTAVEPNLLAAVLDVGIPDQVRWTLTPTAERTTLATVRMRWRRTPLGFSWLAPRMTYPHLEAALHEARRPPVLR